MLFDVTITGDVFQCKLDECFGKIDQVIIIADDNMIVGCKPDHSNDDQTFTNLQQVAKKCNIKFNYDKLQYKLNEVEFFGETSTTCGCKPSKDKVAAMTYIPSSTNKKQVESFIGTINYLAKFSPRLSEIAEPIREFAKDKVPFNWHTEHQAAFTSLKKEIASASVLAFYTPQNKMAQPMALDGTIKPQIANGTTRPQSGFTRLQLTTSNKKYT